LSFPVKLQHKLDEIAAAYKEQSALRDSADKITAPFEDAIQELMEARLEAMGPLADQIEAVGQRIAVLQESTKSSLREHADPKKGLDAQFGGLQVKVNRSRTVPMVAPREAMQQFPELEALSSVWQSGAASMPLNQYLGKWILHQVETGQVQASARDMVVIKPARSPSVSFRYEKADGS
jgi:hypothetical protein